MIDDLQGLLLWGLKDQRRLQGLQTLKQVMNLKTPSKTKQQQPKTNKITDENSISLSKNEIFLKQHAEKTKQRRGLEILFISSDKLPINQLLQGIYYLREADCWKPVIKHILPRNLFSESQNRITCNRVFGTKLTLNPIKKIQSDNRSQEMASVNLLLDYYQPAQRGIRRRIKVSKQNDCSIHQNQPPQTDISNILLLSSDTIGNPGKCLSYDASEAKLLHTVAHLTDTLGKPVRPTITKPTVISKKNLTAAQTMKLSCIEKSYLSNSGVGKEFLIQRSGVLRGYVVCKWRSV